MTIWQACNGPDQIRPISGALYRLVESQEHIATLGYVDTLEEQAMLEALIDTVKPPYRDEGDGYHYLLKTPFRYPPLPWGSRFGRTHERGIFYGGCSVATTLAESAYYRYVFWYSMDAAPIKAQIHSQHTLFSVGYKTRQGIRLHQPPFDAYRAELAHPAQYQATQQLGSAMRDAGVQAFEYFSARDPAGGHCGGLYTLQAMAHKQPRDMSAWLCQASADEVAFKQVGTREVASYPLASFLHSGRLPMPA
ncbi:RES family NAD+ phosphorylase [Bordetella petrii]|uniref:RES family NAD+ phosphorylase n=1 Tax=Bordetella petrii TaxID=94624 RepID=UPI001E5D20B3|nr:RES family NAD+ phosphorylase [Bordetella petrii]MCD0502995.1 RES family NAD+ phosphorylase [Bordetella petrii]